MSSLTIPERTLGWGVLDWCSNNLAQPDGDNAGDMWVFSDEQALFILNYYAVDDNGEFFYRRAMLSRPKGWGKSPLLAAMCCVELLGPVKFAGWDVDGNPVGKRPSMPNIQVVAVAYEQTENTMALVAEMLGQGPAQDRYNLDITLTRVRAPGGGKIERVTAASKSKEGQRPTFAVLDETHLWVEVDGGKALAGVIRRNLGKYGGRSVETTNAPVPGEGSVAEDSDKLADMIREGETTAQDAGFLYDSVEVDVENIYNKEEAMPALRIVYGNSAKENGGWLDLERVWLEINDPATSEADARRFYFNQRVLRGMQWLNPLKWKACLDGELKPLVKQDRIALGFRGQTRNGACAVVATRLSDGAIFVLKHWETSKAAPEIDYVAVDDFVKDCMKFYNVVLMYAAPQNWQDIVGRWYEENEDVVEEFWLNQKLRYAKAVEQFETAVYAGRLKHDGNETLKRHIDNCLLEELTYGHVVRKASTHSDHFISVAEAAILSFDAAQEAIQRGLDEEGPSNYVYSF